MSTAHPPSTPRRAPRLALAVVVLSLLALFAPQALPARAADLPASVTTTATTATLTWTSPTTPPTWTVGRDGTDTGGYGAWSSSVPGSTRSWTFNDLVPGRTYNLYARSSAGTATVRVVAGQAAEAAVTATASQSVTSSGERRATLTWKASGDPATWTVGRDGRDTGGYGAWSTSVPGSTRSWTFNALVPGATYTLSVAGSDGRSAQVRVTVPSSGTPTPTPTPTTPAPTNPPAPGTPGAKARQLFGTPRSGLPWHSGVWTASPFTPGAVDGFGAWRGRPVDFVTTYGYKDSPSKLMNDEWPITTFAGFGGRLNYGLPLAFGTGERTRDVASGSLDHVYRDVARDLVKHRRGDSLIRLGWEYNLSDWTWGTTASTVETFKSAYRRVVGVMRAEAPNLKFEFGVNCGSGLSGNGDRLAALNVGYPGDAYVDLVGCDTYDWWTTTAVDFGKVLRAPYGPGIADVADFARARGKGLSFGEWGLAASRERNEWTGRGDDPAYVEKMFAFFKANADILVMESYFDETDDYIANSLYRNGQNPNAGARYRALWGRG